jgi:uncharacterized protein (TIGR00255 family)
MVFYADRLDVSEELLRFRAHLELLEKRLSDSDLCSGKNLDFLLQELARESHTLSAKVVQAQALHVIVEVKSSIERLRELVQNVE